MLLHILLHTQCFQAKLPHVTTRSLSLLENKKSHHLRCCKEKRQESLCCTLHIKDVLWKPETMQIDLNVLIVDREVRKSDDQSY